MSITTKPTNCLCLYHITIAAQLQVLQGSSASAWDHFVWPVGKSYIHTVDQITFVHTQNYSCTTNACGTVYHLIWLATTYALCTAKPMCSCTSHGTGHLL